MGPISQSSSCLLLLKDHSELERLAVWLEQTASSHALPAQTVFRLDLVLTEAVTNIMEYGRRPGIEGRIELTCAIQDDHIHVELKDDGPAFDPTERAPVVLPKTLDEATLGGLGIHLIQRYTSHMAYRREDDCNILMLTLPIKATPQRQ